MRQDETCGRKLYCLAFQSAGCERLAHPIELQNGVTVSSESPFGLNSYWEEWLGTLQYQRLAESNFVIVAERASANPQVLDEENRALEELAHTLLFAILMHGVPGYVGSLFLTGAKIAEKVEARSVGSPPTYYKHDGAPPFLITEEVIRSADTVAVGLRSIYARQGLFTRLKRGLDAWRRGVQEHRGDYRLHQFVRATEAFVRPRTGASRRQFAHRCQTFAGPSPTTRKVLEEIYDLRSATEHLNDWELALPDVPDQQRVRCAELRAYQAERLAGDIYIRVLSDPTLLQDFQDDASTDAFWSLQDHECRRRWGTPIDLTRLELQQE
jgi:hypothetical protein